jgi:signal transduction histidine kinase
VLLERLIVVLLDNAEQYNLPGGSIAISTGTTDGAAVLRVVNTGPVIPPGQLDRLFLSFTRLDDRTRHEGFGLGLALVSAITAAHGGTVCAAPVPTGGLDVTVLLPRRPSDVSSPSAPTEGARAAVNDLGHNVARQGIQSKITSVGVML